MGLAVALTGTPGTGKSTVSRLLAHRLTVREVGELALELGAGHRAGRSTVVDMVRLARELDRRRSLRTIDLLVGHLAHLLPVRRAIVLRCRPDVLVRRLRGARRGSPADRQANFESEATDVVLIEALRLGRSVREIDTTGRSPATVAREVLRDLVHPRKPSRPTVDWLSIPRVTAHLLDRPR